MQVVAVSPPTVTVRHWRVPPQTGVVREQQSPNSSPQCSTQTPAVQTSPLVQPRPHIPQWLGSVWRLAHCLPQRVCPVMQVGGGSQDPSTHDRPVGQAFRHMPQWLAFVLRFTQTPSQLSCPVGQPVPVWQAPLTHA